MPNTAVSRFQFPLRTPEHSRKGSPGSGKACAGTQLKRAGKWALSTLRKWKGQASAAMLKPMARNANREAGSWAFRGHSLVGPGVPKSPLVCVIFGAGHVMSKCLSD